MSRLKYFILIFLFFIPLQFVLVQGVLAQDQGPNINPTGVNDGDGGKTAAAGTVVAAAMESIGYQAQAQILSQISDTLKELGGLIYLGVLVSAILTAGLMGNYAPALWLLIGPPLFLFVSGVSAGDLGNTIHAHGSDWQFGAFKDEGGHKQKIMRRSDSDVEVSFVFHKFNELISEVYQELIKKITSSDASTHMLFMARQRMLEDLFAMEIRDGRTKELAAMMMISCSRELTLARYLAQGRRKENFEQDANYKLAEEQYCRRFPQFDKQIDNVGLAEYLSTLENPHKKGENVSCLQMWGWLRQSVIRDVAAQGEEKIRSMFGPDSETTLAAGASIEQRMLAGVYEKIVTKQEGTSAVKDPCPFAGEQFNGGIEEQGGVFTALANIFSGNLIRKEQTHGSNATAFRQILSGDMTGFSQAEDSMSGGLRVNLAGKESLVRRMKAQEMATARKFEAFNLLMIIPYFQGALLYTLSVCYPFFAMMVLIPGHAGSFLNWMALWAWAKSWDVGWSIVMVTDKLLWELMPHSTFYDATDGGAEGFTPVNVMEMHFSGDYSYSVSLYWMTVSMLVTSVPIITAEAILGAKKAVSGVVLSGANDIASRLSSNAEAYVATANVGRIMDPAKQAEGKEMIEKTTGSAAGMSAMQQNIASSMGSSSIAKTADSQHKRAGDALNRLSGGEGGSSYTPRDAAKESTQERNNRAANNNAKDDAK